MNRQQYSFERLAELLRTADADCGAAEAHGLLCGSISAGGRCSSDLWMEHLLGTDNTLSAAAHECRDMLESMQNDMLAQFNDESFGFNVMLPDDTVPLSVRTGALS